jgi:hypothetical protein
MGFFGSMAHDFNEPRVNALGAVQGAWRDDMENVMTPRGSFADQMGRSRKNMDAMTGGLVGLALSPIVGAMDVVTRPIAHGAQALGLGDEAANREILNTASMAIAPTRVPGRSAIVAGPPRPNPANAMARTVARFDQARVQPSLAAAGGPGAQATANTVMENSLAGMRARGNTQAQIGQAQASAGRLSRGYGAERGPQIAGENVQAGIARFANDADTPGTFAARSEELYDAAFAPIIQGQQTAFLANSVAAPVTAIETEATLNAIATRVGGEIGALITSPRIGQITQAIQADRGATTFEALRDLRSWVRRSQREPELRQDMDMASLQSIERALTADIYRNAEALGGPGAAAQLRRADQYYRAGMGRINTALQPFADAKSGETAYQRIIQAAGSGGSADAAKLSSLKRSLARNEWGDVASTVVQNLGRPSAGAAGAVGGEGFSINNFVTNYNKLSQTGRDVLFGSRGGGGANATSLQAELDNLVRVVDDLKALASAANSSKSAVNIQNAGTLTGGAAAGTASVLTGNPLPIVGYVSALGTMAGAGEMLTNPAFVRWLTRSATAATPAAQSASMTQLQNLAGTSPAIAEFVRQLAAPNPAEVAPRVPAARPLEAAQ